MVSKDKIDRVLYATVIALTGALVSLNVFMVVKFNQAMVVRPKEVMERLEERLAVTPQMVMQRLNEIEASHMKWVKEYDEKDGGAK